MIKAKIKSLPAAIVAQPVASTGGFNNNEAWAKTIKINLFGAWLL